MFLASKSENNGKQQKDGSNERTDKNKCDEEVKIFELSLLQLSSNCSPGHSMQRNKNLSSHKNLLLTLFFFPNYHNSFYSNLSTFDLTTFQYNFDDISNADQIVSILCTFSDFSLATKKSCSYLGHLHFLMVFLQVCFSVMLSPSLHDLSVLIL